MMFAPVHHIWTIEEFLCYQEMFDTKHEFLDGSVYAMAGASEPHNRIAINTSSALHTLLRKGACSVYGSDMMVQAPGLLAYPDISVVCGTPQFLDDKRPVLLNPVLLAEILSSSTAKYDRGEKFRRYQQITSLQHYLLIAQDKVHIEHYIRQNETEWLLTETSDLTASIEIAALQVALAVADVYEKTALG
jgi:Uma2 family endonuclease